MAAFLNACDFIFIEVYKAAHFIFAMIKPSLMRLLPTLFLFFLVTTVAAQNRHIDSLILRISQLQATGADTNYPAGIFPSQRVYLSRKKLVKEDDNIFFTGLIIWTLKSIREQLSVKNQAIVDAMAAKAIANYYRYQNKDGRPVYNFWQTNPSRHFPNSRYFSRRKKYIIPDDLDDTAILYLSAEFSDSLKRAVKKLMAENANGQKRRIRNTFRRYKNVPAYSTWFGKNMPVDFDICVQANGMRLVLDNQLELNRYDSATIRLMKDMLIARKHIKRPHYTSPHYQSTPIILYHLARLVAAHSQHPLLADVKPLLVKDLKKEMQRAGNGMEQILLQTSLSRLHEPAGESIHIDREDWDNFYFFVANMTSVFPNPIKGIFANSRKTNFFYRSEAYYLTLLVENEMLRFR